VTVHVRHIADADLQAMLARTPYADDLRTLVERAQATIGFFPAHNPRALEYPWVLASLPVQLGGMRILDVGAGVNPLPFVLADRGAQVVTLDNHPLTRSASDRAAWNEWGFLDYATLDARIRSIRCAWEDARLDETFDAIYSVSVIEHVPAAVRRAWIGQFARYLETGGRLLLTVDITPDSDRLWNRSEGNVVDAACEHGTFATLLDELRHAGFAIDHTGIERAIPDARIDAGFIGAWRQA
jgi:SAM-dependent methyltransferase